MQREEGRGKRHGKLKKRRKKKCRLRNEEERETENLTRGGRKNVGRGRKRKCEQTERNK
jgi:hypothetical protein